MPLKICLCVSVKSRTVIRLLCSPLMNNHLILYLRFLSLEVSGSSQLCQSKHLILNLLSMLGFSHPAVREGATETFNKRKEPNIFLDTFKISNLCWESHLSVVPGRWLCGACNV